MNIQLSVNDVLRSRRSG